MKIKPFEIYRDKRGKYRWRATSQNGRILAQSSESYTRKLDCNVGAAETLGILDRWFESNLFYHATKAVKL